MKKLFNIFMLLSLLSQLKSQVVAPQLAATNSHPSRCYTVEAFNNFLKAHPDAQTMEQFEGWMQTKLGERRRTLTANGKTTPQSSIVNYTLPIVFHVMEKGEPVGQGDNISQALIQAQLLQLNKDYANLSGSQYSVASPTGIQFALAAQDPNGNTLAEPGIDRVNAAAKGWTTPYDYTTLVEPTMKPATIWDPYRYINVWLLGDFKDGTTTGLLGIAELPTCPQLKGLSTSETDKIAGVCVLTSSVGSIFSSTSCGSTTANPYNLGRTLTHELGHFFGLRHIWGDGTCATDYCDDTPIHLTSNFGKPTHPKPNTCGTADEMFEDYMDYTDDDAMSIFTVNQMERMQIVMLNSARRMTVGFSNVPTAGSLVSNKIGFAQCTGALTVTETGNAGTVQRYKDVSIALNVENMATGNSKVVFKTTGTAKKNIDYKLIPDTLTFVQGDGTKFVTLRVLDNNTIDTDRTVILKYAIIGTGVSFGTTGQTLTITIQDDDNKIIGNNSQKIINEDFGTTGGTFPKGWSTDISTGNTNSFVVGPSSQIGTGQWAYLTNNTTTKPLTYTTSATTNYADIILPVLNGTPYKSIDSLKFKYKVGGSYNKTSKSGSYGSVVYSVGKTYNSQSAVPLGNNATLTGSGPYYTATNSPVIALNGLNLNFNFQIGFKWYSNTRTGVNPGFCIDDVVLSATPYPIDSIISSSYTMIAPANTNNLMRDTSDNIIASITSPSTTLQNLTVSLTEAGNGKIGFSTGTSVYQRSQKVFNLNNGPADSTTSYKLTLYFTANELQIWGGLSGLRVLHLKDGVPMTATIINPTNSEILAPTSVVDNQATSGYAAVTVSVKGLGSFALVDSSVILPISWKFVSGNIQNNATLLKWALGNDDGKTRFNVEKSSDGIHFTSLADNVFGNSFTDAAVTPAAHYYYRIVAKTADGATLYSQVINVVYLSNHHSITIAPNPFSNYLTIQNNGILSGTTHIAVYDIAGREVYVNKNGTQSTTNINTANWHSGVYIVKINNNGEPFTYKLIKD